MKQKKAILLAVSVTLVLVMLVLAVSVSARPEEAPAPMVFDITYQGRLADAAGNPLANQTINITFSVYEQSIGGAAIWSQNGSITTDANGLFTTILAIDPPLKPGGVEAINNLWLGVKVGSDPEMTPRQRITGSAYAITLIPGASISGTVSSTQQPYAMLAVNNTGTGAAIIARSEKGNGAVLTSDEGYALVVGGSVLMEGSNLRRIALHRWYEVNEAAIRFQVGGEPKGVLFDGMSIWVSNSISNTVTRRLVADGSPKQLCCLSNRLSANKTPPGRILDHGVENHEQLVHAGDQGDLLPLASVAQALIELSNDGIVA